MNALTHRSFIREAGRAFRNLRSQRICRQPELLFLERFQSSRALFRFVKGGIYFHLSGQKIARWGPRLRKMPLGSVFSGYSNSGVAERRAITPFLTRLFPLAPLLLTVSACRSPGFPQYPANYREYAYVTNGGSGTVTVLDVVDVRVDGELRVGLDPVAVAASPTRNEIYVVNAGAPGGVGSLSVIDAEHNTVVATIPLHRRPLSIDVDAAGKLAYVANSGSNTVSIIDLEARREIAQIGAGVQPVVARLAPDGKALIVADKRGNSVTIIDPVTRRIRAVISGCPGALDPVILADSSKAFVPCSAGHQVMVIALAPAGQPDQMQTLMDVGSGPVALALKPDGGELFAVNSLSDSISEVVTNSNDVSGAHMMGDDPVCGLVSRDNSLLYISNFLSQNLIVYSINDGKRADSIHVGDGPSALAFSASGYLLFAVDFTSDDVAVIRTPSQALFTLLPTGRDPNAIVDKTFKLP